MGGEFLQNALEQSDLLLLMEENGAIAITTLQSLSQRLRQRNTRPDG